MFAIYGTSGQMFQGPFEELRKVAPTLRVARARAVEGELLRVDAWGDDPGRAARTSARAVHNPVTEHALQAYAATREPDGGRHPLSQVADVMSHEPMLLADALTVWAALQQLAAHGRTQAPVVNAQQQLVGLLTAADFLRPDRLPDPSANALIWRAQMAQPVTEWMLSPVASVAPQTDIRRLAMVLLDTGLPGLPVVVAGGVVMGYVSRSDILRAVTHDPPLDLWAR